jgi:hypothetical protein
MMARIIAGRFHTQAQADAALAALGIAGFAREDLSSFYLSAPGQHDLQPMGGDTEHHSEGTKHAGKTAVAGGAIGGVAGLAIGTAAAAALDPGFTAIAAAAGAGVGAYAGSLAGGVSGSRQSDPQQATHEEPVERKAGIMVAVHAEAEGREDRAIQSLRSHGALEIERAEGDWRDGAWSDFDPLRTPRLV